MNAHDSKISETGNLAPGNFSLGFTLVELLVVMAILGLLVALFFPSARESLQRAATIDCLSDMRQMGLAVQMFANENDGRLPGTSHAISWTNSLAVYLGPNFIGRCPSVPKHRARITYGWNDCLVTNGMGIHIESCLTPAATMMMAELAIDQTSEHFHFAGVRGGAARLTPNQFKAAVHVEAHGTSANYLFVDGHAETLSWSEVQLRLTQNNPTFIVP